MTADLQKADQEAQKLLEQNYIAAPPVDVYELVQNYGLQVIEVDFGDELNTVSGYINTEKGIIYVNLRDPENRRKFTVAHELGHWILHKEKLQQDPEKYAILFRIPIGRLNDDPVESEANRFAAEILVPQEFLSKAIKELGNEVAALAQRFEVSQDVIGYRLKDLHPDEQQLQI